MANFIDIHNYIIIKIVMIHRKQEKKSSYTLIKCALLTENPKQSTWIYHVYISNQKKFLYTFIKFFSCWTELKNWYMYNGTAFIVNTIKNARYKNWIFKITKCIISQHNGDLIHLNFPTLFLHKEYNGSQLGFFCVLHFLKLVSLT